MYLLIRIAAWLITITVPCWYLKVTSVSYHNYLIDESIRRSVEIPITAYFPFLLFALGAIVLAIGLYVLILEEFVDKL